MGNSCVIPARIPGSNPGAIPVHGGSRVVVVDGCGGLLYAILYAGAEPACRAATQGLPTEGHTQSSTPARWRLRVPRGAFRGALCSTFI